MRINDFINKLDSYEKQQIINDPVYSDILKKVGNIDFFYKDKQLFTREILVPFFEIYGFLDAGDKKVKTKNMFSKYFNKTYKISFDSEALQTHIESINENIEENIKKRYDEIIFADGLKFENFTEDYLGKLIQDTKTPYILFSDIEYGMLSRYLYNILDNTKQTSEKLEYAYKFAQLIKNNILVRDIGRYLESVDDISDYKLAEIINKINEKALYIEIYRYRYKNGTLKIEHFLYDKIITFLSYKIENFTNFYSNIFHNIFKKISSINKNFNIYEIYKKIEECLLNLKNEIPRLKALIKFPTYKVSDSHSLFYDYKKLKTIKLKRDAFLKIKKDPYSYDFILDNLTLVYTDEIPLVNIFNNYNKYIYVGIIGNKNIIDPIIANHLLYTGDPQIKYLVKNLESVITLVDKIIYFINLFISDQITIESNNDMKGQLKEKIEGTIKEIENNRYDVEKLKNINSNIIIFINNIWGPYITKLFDVKNLLKIRPGEKLTQSSRFFNKISEKPRDEVTEKITELQKIFSPLDNNGFKPVNKDDLLDEIYEYLNNEDKMINITKTFDEYFRTIPYDEQLSVIKLIYYMRNELFDREIPPKKDIWDDEPNDLISGMVINNFKIYNKNE